MTDLQIIWSMSSASIFGNSTVSDSNSNGESMETVESSGEMDSTSINEVHRVMPDTAENEQVL